MAALARYNSGMSKRSLAVLLVIAIFSGIYIYGRLSVPPEAPAQPVFLGFKGKVPPEISIGDASKKQVIFTFDCGGSTQSADAILKALARHHLIGTFFMTGLFARKYPDIVKRIAAEGHEIFNHTDTHPHLTEIPDWQIKKELAALDLALMKLTGKSAQPYFRAPYGDRDQRVLAAAAQAGYQSVYWTDDALDWEQPTGMTAGKVHDRILAHLKPGAIYLMHMGDSITGKILDQVFNEIETKGYKVVSLTQGLAAATTH